MLTDKIVDPEILNGFVSAFWISEGSANCSSPCLDTVYVLREEILDDLDIQANELIKFENVNILPPYNVNLKAPEVHLQQEFELATNATLNTYNIGCQN